MATEEQHQHTPVAESSKSLSFEQPVVSALDTLQAFLTQAAFERGQGTEEYQAPAA